MTKYISVRQQLWQEPVFSPEEGEEFAPTRHQVDCWKAEASNFPATFDELPYGRRDWWDILATRAYQAGRASVAKPPAEGPNDEEIISQADKFLAYSDAHMGDPARWEGSDVDLVAFTRHAIARWGHPAPVPVSEPGPGPEDCDAEGQCWWFNPGQPAMSNPHIATSSWRLCRMINGKPMGTHFLPAHALPFYRDVIE